MIPGTCVRTGDGAVQGEGKGFFVFIVVCDVVALILAQKFGVITSTHQHPPAPTSTSTSTSSGRAEIALR
jgi:hypothetical protein